MTQARKIDPRIHGRLAYNKGALLPLKVLQSAAGFYIGTRWELLANGRQRTECPFIGAVAIEGTPVATRKRL